MLGRAPAFADVAVPAELLRTSWGRRGMRRGQGRAAARASDGGGAGSPSPQMLRVHDLGFRVWCLGFRV